MILDPERLRVEHLREVEAWLGVKDRYVSRQPITVNDDGTVEAELICRRDPATGQQDCLRCEWSNDRPVCHEDTTITPTGPLPAFLTGTVPDRFEDET